MRTVLVLPIIAIFAIVSLSRSSFAQEADSPEIAEARRHFRSGVEAQDSGHYREALGHYRAVTIKSPALLFNIGTCHERLNELLAAESAFGQALEEAEARKMAEVVAESRTKLVVLREEVPRVRIRIPSNIVVDDSLRVFVDDRPVVVTAERRVFDLRLDPGSHRVVVRSDHQLGVFSVAVDLPVWATRVVDVDLGGTRTDPEPKTVVIERDASRKTYVPAILAGGGALGFGAAAIVTGVVGHGHRTHYDELNAAPTNENITERESVRSKGETLFVANAIFIGLTTLATGTAIYFLVRPPRASSTTARTAQSLLRGSF